MAQTALGRCWRYNQSCQPGSGLYSPLSVSKVIQITKETKSLKVNCLYIFHALNKFFGLNPLTLTFRLTWPLWPCFFTLIQWILTMAASTRIGIFHVSFLKSLYFHENENAKNDVSCHQVHAKATGGKITSTVSKCQRFGSLKKYWTRSLPIKKERKAQTFDVGKQNLHSGFSKSPFKVT